MTKPYLVVTITYNTPAKLVLIKPYGLRNSGDFFIPQYNTTGKNNGFPFLDILVYLKNTHKNPKFAKWDKSQPGNSQLSSQVGTCLTLQNLGFLWVFFKYPKISKNGKYPLFFPVHDNLRET